MLSDGATLFRRAENESLPTWLIPRSARAVVVVPMWLAGLLLMACLRGCSSPIVLACGFTIGKAIFDGGPVSYDVPDSTAQLGYLYS
jgi:hypothetical protein